MATPQQNEKKLDLAETLIHEVIKDIGKDLAKYRASDLAKLRQAFVSLNQVTLRQDI